MTIPLKQKYDRLRECIQAGVDSWIAAGRIVVELLDQGETLQSLAATLDSPLIQVGTLAAFERIGRGQVLPTLIIADYPAASRMRSLPLSEQKRLLEQPIDLLVLRDNGTDTLSVDVRNVTQKQAKQLFRTGSVRSLAEQRAWLEEQAVEERLTQSLRQVDVPYVIKNNRVIFRAGAELTRKEITVLLTQLE